jgi:hypothetical protein
MKEIPDGSTDPKRTISKKMIEDFERFVEYHPAERFSRNLRSFLLEFLMYDGSAEAEYLRDLVIDMDGLFGLLDTIIDEQKLMINAGENPESK